MSFAKYDPEIHDSHWKRFSDDDLVYMCYFWESTKKEDLAAALGKTHGAIVAKGVKLRKKGMFDVYRKMGEGIYR